MSVCCNYTLYITRTHANTPAQTQRQKDLIIRWENACASGRVCACQAVSVAVDFRNVSSLSCQRVSACVNALGYRCSAECKRVCM